MSRKQLGRLSILAGLFALVLSFFVTVRLASGQQIVGKVIKTTGTVVVLRARSTHPLSAFSNVLKGDFITTASDGYAQIQIADGGLLTMSSNTSLHLDDIGKLARKAARSGDVKMSSKLGIR